MISSLAKLAARLNVDGVTNGVVERLYRSTDSDGWLSRRFQIVTYHRVSPETHPLFEPLNPEVFEQQMRFLSELYEVMPLGEIMERASAGEIPDRAVAVTFDDGYRDNYEFAFPILRKYRIPATIFLATGVIGTNELLWHDRVFDAFGFASVSHARLNDQKLKEVNLDTPESIRQSIRDVRRRVAELYGRERMRLVEEIEQALKPGPPRQSQPRMLDWDQVRKMNAAGIEFGSHTVTHPIVSRIPREDLLKELRQSKREVSENIGSSVVSFAYPNGLSGDFNDEVKAALRECGYAYAVTSQTGFNNRSSDPFELKRVQPWHKQIEVFRMTFFLQRHGLAS